MTETREPLLYDPVPDPTDDRTVHLDPAWTVNEVLLRFPPSTGVFNAFGVDACCGGANSLTNAAEQAGVAPAALLGTLEATIVRCGCDG